MRGTSRTTHPGSSSQSGALGRNSRSCLVETEKDDETLKRECGRGGRQEAERQKAKMKPIKSQKLRPHKQAEQQFV